MIGAGRFPFLSILMACAVIGCSSASTGPSLGPGGNGGGDAGVSGDAGADGGGKSEGEGGGPSKDGGSTSGDGGATEEDSGIIADCADVVVQPELAKLVDVVWVIDNSGSMDDEASAVATNLVSFAEALLASDLDYRLIVISRDGFVPEYDQLRNTLPNGRFLFINENVGSQDPLGDLLKVYDRYEVALRESAVTHFVAVTDDETRCVGNFIECNSFTWLGGWTDGEEASAAHDQFMTDMMARHGRPFVFHAIASPDPRCDGAASPGRAYYQLADTTGGEQFEICTNDWSGLFDQLGTAVAESASVSCSISMPEPPAGLALNPEQVSIELGLGGNASSLTRVASGAQCDMGDWHYDRPLLPQLIELCPERCAELQGNADAKLDVTLGCGSNACAGVSTEADLFSTPVDIVWVIDNSGSMNDEAQKIEDNLGDFAEQIEASGIDYRVFVVRAQEADFVIPFGERFYSIDISIESWDALHRTLGSFATISENMRPDAVTHFVFVSDDESGPPDDDNDPADAERVQETIDWFIQQMTSSDRLGREFIAHAVASEDPTCSSDDNSAFNPGRVYYGLADQTGGTTFSICESDWEPLFDLLSEAVVTSTPVDCSFDLPEPPEDQLFDPDEVNVRFGYSGAAAPTVVGRTSGAGECDAGGWYYDDPANPSSIQLCQSTCDEIQGLTGAAIDIQLGCETEVVEIL